MPTIAGGVPNSQQTALARLTVSPGTPTAANGIATATRPAATTATTPQTVPATATPAPAPNIAVPEVPGLRSSASGTPYTNPAMTFRFLVPPDWSSPAPEGPQNGRVTTRAPGNAATLTVEDGVAPEDWQRAAPPAVAATLDRQYRVTAPDRTLQTAVLTAVSGANDFGAPTYRLTYTGTESGAAVTVERFVMLTPVGAIITTVTAPAGGYGALRPTVEGIVGSVVPLKLDAPTPAALAPSGGTANLARTPSGFGVALPAGWMSTPAPMMPPGVEYAAQSADSAARLRVVRKTVSEKTTLNDASSTISGELKASAVGYSIESEGANTVNGARAVRVIYRATVGGREIVGQSITFLRCTTAYALFVEVPAAQYDMRQPETEMLFDRIGGSVVLP